MNWSWWRTIPWIDSRAAFVAAVPKRGRLLDLGCSDGRTLTHMSELRPDLQFHAVDIGAPPEVQPPRLDFRNADLERDDLPWPDGYFDAITCMHLIEHLRESTKLWSEIARLLKPGGRAYIETPGPQSVNTKSAPGRHHGTVTLNFYDDPTHIAPVSIEEMTSAAARNGLTIRDSGRSRNWLFALSYPFFLILPASRKRYVAKLHFTGWSIYVIAEKSFAQ